MADAEQKSVAETTPDQKKRHRSVGERVFDFVVYGPVNFFGTLIATVPIAYSLEHGFFKEGFDKLAKNLMKTPFARTKKGAADILRTTTLMMGGNVMLFPVRWAESRKIGFVEKINHMAGDKTDPKSVEEAPKQTWGSLLLGRAVAWLTVFFSMKGAVHLLGRDKFEAFEFKFAKNWFADPLKKATHTAKAPAAVLGDFNRLATQRGSRAEEITAVAKELEPFETKTFRYGKLLALDIFATIAATTLLYIGSHFFASRNAKKHAMRDAAPAIDKLPESTIAPAAPVKEKDQETDKPRSEVVANSVAAERALSAAAPSVSVT